MILPDVSDIPKLFPNMSRALHSLVRLQANHEDSEASEASRVFLFSAVASALLGLRLPVESVILVLTRLEHCLRAEAVFLDNLSEQDDGIDDTGWCPYLMVADSRYVAVRRLAETCSGVHDSDNSGWVDTAGSLEPTSFPGKTVHVLSINLVNLVRNILKGSKTNDPNTAENGRGTHPPTEGTQPRRVSQPVRRERSPSHQG